MEDSGGILPKWAREIGRFLSMKPQFVLWGNVHDIYPLPPRGDEVATPPMPEFLGELLAPEGYALVVRYEPLEGFSLVQGDGGLFFAATGEQLPDEGVLPSALTRGAEIAERIVSCAEFPCALVISCASRLEDLSRHDAPAFFFRMHRLGKRARPHTHRRIAPGVPVRPRFNLLFWLLDKENDLPPWYALDNPRVRVLPVPRPDAAIRRELIGTLARSLASGAEDPVDERKRAAAMQLFTDATGGLFTSEIRAIAQGARQEGIPLENIGEAIRRYRLGIEENPWSRLNPATMRSAEEFLGERVMGQEYAVRMAANILKRSIFNLSGAQFSRLSQRPKGVLFLAGPTGVGKTELAKAITELVFGAPTHYIRFDMSEFGHEHADQRLIGAPPGYIGYDVGGELTSAMKGNPFSVVLFDEIEKAHRKILDMFLQVLDDGRLTSGRGETVYFSESLVIFTSNLGIYDVAPDGTRVARVDPSLPYEELRPRIQDAIGGFFRGIQRPEILNRLGKNIVVFDFLRPATAVRIFHRMLENVLRQLEEDHRIELSFAPEVRQRLGDVVCADLSMGGRGIGNALEEVFVNPLSRGLFEAGVRPGERATVRRIDRGPLGWTLELERAPMERGDETEDLG